MFKIIGAVKDAVWGLPTLSLLLFAGIYFTYKSGFCRPNAIKRVAKNLYSSLKTPKKDGISPFSAVATALGGTVGIGSIVGVGYALSMGGAGSIFWMWVCSFFGMGLKYAEIKISLNGKSQKSSGGAPFRLASLGYKKTAVIFCLFCIAASFGTGNLTQSGAIASFLLNRGVSPLLSATLCCALIGFAVFGGKKRIAKANEVLIPLASAVYLAACLCIIILNASRLGYAFREIFKGAFGISAVTGGFSGAMLSHVIREGFARSLFSNEAGMGSSPLAHGSVESNEKTQAEWGLFEIFFDTFMVSTLTALCMLSGGFTDASAVFLSAFGKIGLWLMGILLALFAFASVISWCYYGQCCLEFMFPNSKKAAAVYKTLFSLSAFFGVYASGDLIWETADLLNAFMLFPNMFLLFKCRKEIERI